jgi:hypothetical protein
MVGEVHPNGFPWDSVLRLSVHSIALSSLVDSREVGEHVLRVVSGDRPLAD